TAPACRPPDIPDPAGPIPQPPRCEIMVRTPETPRRPSSMLARAADVGYRDERNFPFTKDRLEDGVITGGFNLHPSDGGGVPVHHSAVREAIPCTPGPDGRLVR